MPPRSSRPTHRSIVAQVAQIRRSLAEAPLREAQSQLAAVLDGVNALGALDALREAGLSKVLSGGPLVVQGAAPAPWVGAVLWQRAPGYFGYKMLALYGVWALRVEGETELRAGVRRLAYALDFYEADAYHKRIRKEFALYYADDGAPPAEETAVWTARYAPEDRLALRAAVEGVVRGLLSG